MKRYQEENCGRVDLQKLVETKEMVEGATGQGHLLSCGGIYISREPEEPALLSRFDYLTLQNSSKSIVVLKNLKVHRKTHTETDLFSGPESEDVREPHSPDTLKRIFKENLN